MAIRQCGVNVNVEDVSTHYVFVDGSLRYPPWLRPSRYYGSLVDRK
jgi:hypothetical protein